MFPNLYSPAFAAQHPQPCLLLLRRSNECRFPSHHTKTAHALYSPALPRARREHRFSALSGPKCSKTCAPPRPRPSTPNPAYCFSEEVTKVGFLPTIQRQHMLCIPLHCRGCAGEHRSSALSGPKCSKTCTPPRPRPSTPNPALLLLRRSNESRFPSHHTETAHALYSPALPRARGGVQVFSTFRPQTFQNLYYPSSVAQHPQPCLLLLRRSNDRRFPSHQTKSAHDLYSPALPRACGGVQFQHLQATNVPKPVLPRVPGPAPPTLLPSIPNPLVASPKK